VGGGVVAPAGSVWSRRRYDPYGETRYTYGRSPTDFAFTGQREDGGTGLMYYRARYYHPALGRFVSADAIVPDPQNPADFNRYSYVRNNALRYTDPSGHGLCEGWDCEEPEVPAGWPWRPPGHPSRPSQTPDSWLLWALLAQEMGPRDEQGRVLIHGLTNPWPDLSNQRSELVELWATSLNWTLAEVYGGEAGLTQRVLEACEFNQCNNPWLETDLWHFNSETSQFLATQLAGAHSQASPLGYFLRQIRADELHLANYEPWWMWELQQQHPRRLAESQGRWVLEVYLVDRDIWHQLTRGGWSGWRPISTDVPAPTLP